MSGLPRRHPHHPPPGHPRGATIVEPATSAAALLRQYREIRNLSQNRLAEMIGVDHAHVSRLEHGTRTPGHSVLGRYVRALVLTDDEIRALALALWREEDAA